MKDTYRVTYIAKQFYYMDVQANSADEAEYIAEKDGDNFIPLLSDDWEVHKVIKLEKTHK